MAGLYIHIPFCSSKCYYCDFFSRRKTDDTIVEQYVDALCKEIELQKNYLGNNKINTIYFGGGTPSVLNVSQIDKILKTIDYYFDTTSLEEVTFEANPEDLKLDYVSDLKRYTNIDRFSIGIQSFFNTDLKFMNRKHTSQDAIAAVKNVRKVGFENVTVDLIYGLPGMTVEKWEDNLHILFELDVPHFSAYHLTIEDDTVFGVWKRQGKLKEIDEELSLKLFEVLIDNATKFGYSHYEISNFAKPGYISVHNFSYWTGKKYLGVGTSANSYDGKSRQWNVANINEYIRSINEGIVPFEMEILSPKDHFNEYVITGLRTYLGIRKDLLENRFPKYYREILPVLQNYIQAGMILEKPENYVLTKQGKFISDTIMRDLIVL